MTRSRRTEVPVGARPGPGPRRAAAAPPAEFAALLFLQSAAGNRAVGSLIATAPRGAMPAIQRVVWGKDPATGDVVRIGDSPSRYVLDPDVLSDALRPGDRYDEATGLVSRADSSERRLGRPRQVRDRSPKRRESPKSKAAHAKHMADARKQRTREISKGARLSHAVEARHADLAAAAVTPIERGVHLATGQPAVRFGPADEQHNVYPEARPGGGWRLMVASFPLPVADFVLDLQVRFDRIAAKAEDTTRYVIKVLPQLKRSEGNFQKAMSAAAQALAAADAMFADPASTRDARGQAEEALAQALHRMITVVHQLADRFGRYRENPEKSRKIRGAGHYLAKMGGALERYRVEGLVARYQEQPDYPGSDFDRDHQPHNDLIETMAELPEFQGRKMQDVAAGRTQLGWSILLHHDRHAAGRTFATKGGQVTSAFLASLEGFRLTGPTLEEVRQFCMDHLVQSLRDDVAVMKTVAGDPGSYADLDASVAAAVAKKTPGGQAPDPAVLDQEKSKWWQRVRDQIMSGEDRMLATEGAIRTYSDPS